MEKTGRSPAEHIASLPAERREDIERIDALIAHLMAGQPKTMWEGRLWGGTEQQIIGYGDYTYRKSNGETVEWFIVGLAVQRNYISVYVNATDGRAYLAERYAARLGKAKVGKSSISFRSIDDVDLQQLSDLITEAKRLMT
jgi:hypothetical protein